MLQSRNKTKYRIIGLFAVLFVLAPTLAGAYQEDIIKNGNFEDPDLSVWNWSGGVIDDIAGNIQAKFTGNGYLKQTIDHVDLSSSVTSEIANFYFMGTVQEATLNVRVKNPDGVIALEETFSNESGGFSVVPLEGVKKGALLEFHIEDADTGALVIIDNIEMVVRLGELPTETPTPSPTGPTPTPTRTPTPTPTDTPLVTETPTETPIPTNTPTPTPQTVTRLQVSANPNYISASADDFDEEGKATSRIQMKAIHANGSVERTATAKDFTVEVEKGLGTVGDIDDSKTLDGVVYAQFTAAGKGRALIKVTYSNSQTTNGEPITASVGILVDVVETKSGSSIVPKKKSVLYQRWK